MFESLRFCGFLIPVVFACAIVSATALSAGDGFQNASPEILVSGPDDTELGTNVAFPDAGVDEAGRQIYVWENFGPTNGIGMRRFDRVGNPLEDPRLIVADVGPSNPQRPRVAVAADGSCMVIWQSSEDLGGGSLERWIRGQFFDSAGVATGPPQLVSTIATGGSGLLSDSDIAALRHADGTSGGFVAVWTSNNPNPAGSDASSTSIQAQLLTAMGVPTGDQIEVNNVTSGGQRKPTVTEMPDGGFLVVWVHPNVQARRFSAAGAPLANQFQVSTDFNSQDEPDVAIGWDGSVLVVWEDFEDFSNSTEIRARFFDSALSPSGNDFRVNTVIAEPQDLPRIADFGPAGFIVSWESRESSAGPDTDSESIQARIVTGGNSFGSAQIQYNVWGDGLQGAPGAHGWYGFATVGWDGAGNADDPPPGNTQHVMARTIEHCMFCDDFEWFDPGTSASLWRWSAVVGADP